MTGRQEVVAWAALGAAAALAPTVLSATWINVAILTLFYVLLCVSWNIVGGIAGQFSIGHSLFVAIGAYTPAVLLLQAGVSPWVGMLAGAALAAASGAAIAWLSFRYALPQLAFSQVTLGIAMLGFLGINSIDALGASRGLMLPDEGGVAMFRFEGDTGFYGVILALAAGAVAVSRALYPSRAGLHFRTVRDNERAATAIGVPVLRVKLQAMATSAAMTSVGGTFLAQYLQIVEPRSFAGLALSIETILFTVVGGTGTIAGPVVGPLLLVPLGEWLRGALGGQVPGLHLLVYGVLLVVILRVAPGGLVGVVRRWLQR